MTGAFDDAAASLYGNVVVTDNRLRKILRTYPVEDHQVLLLVPREKAYSADVDLKRIKTVARQVETAHEEALAGKYWNAMTLNGLSLFARPEASFRRDHGEHGSRCISGRVSQEKAQPMLSS